MKYIIAQLLAFIAFGISLIAFHRKKKEKIFANMMISNILNLFHYLLLGAYSGCITKVIAIFRDFSMVVKKDNNKKINKVWLVVLISIYIIGGFVTYKDILSLFPIIAAIIYTISCWNGNALKVKKTAFFCDILWLVYNIWIFSLVGILAKFVSVISDYIAVKNAEIKLKESKK